MSSNILKDLKEELKIRELNAEDISKLPEIIQLMDSQEKQLASQKELINSLLEVVEFDGNECNYHSWCSSYGRSFENYTVEITDEDCEGDKDYRHGGKKARKILASDMVREFRGD